tara:strand:- start:335 stop:547 length:213 start_codon:yes stop_codon:yes gene_type:complete
MPRRFAGHYSHAGRLIMTNPKTPLKISDKFVTFTPAQSLDALYQQYKSSFDVKEPDETKTDYCNRMGFDM